MAESFKDRVSAHLDATQKKMADANKSAHLKRLEDIDYLNRFDAMAKQTIHPVLMAARDEMLGRNIPADVVYFRDDNAAKPTSSIALHFAHKGTMTMGDVRTSPQFRLAYIAQNQNTWRPKVPLNPNDSTSILISIEKINTEIVEEDVMRFLQAYNPQ